MQCSIIKKNPSISITSFLRKSSAVLKLQSSVKCYFSLCKMFRIFCILCLADKRFQTLQSCDQWTNMVSKVFWKFQILNVYTSNAVRFKKGDIFWYRSSPFSSETAEGIILTRRFSTLQLFYKDNTRPHLLITSFPLAPLILTLILFQIPKRFIFLLLLSHRLFKYIQPSEFSVLSSATAAPKHLHNILPSW